MVLLAGIVGSRWQKLAIGQNIQNYNTRDRFRSRRKRGNQNHQLGIQEMNVNIPKTKFAVKQS